MFGVLLIINAAVIILVFRHYSILPAGQQMGQFISQQIQALDPLLQDLSIDQKKTYLNQLYPKNQITVSQNPPQNELPSFKFYTAIAEILSQHNLTAIKYQTSNPQNTIWVKSGHADDTWYGFAFESFMSKAKDMVQLIFFILLIISLASAYAFSRYSLRPLQQLAKVAKGQAKDPNYMPEISVQGANEVKEVAKLVQRTILKHRALADEKQTFLAGVSHDLRTPLTRIRFQLEWLQDEKQKNDIIDELNEMNQIIDDFMSYIKGPESLSASTGISVAELKSYITERYDLKGQKINLEMNQTNTTLKVHASHIKRVMMNLIDNAIHHGLPPIEITSTKHGKIIKLTIKDYGKGLNKQTTTSQAQQGYGFGLKVVKKLLEINHIKFNLDSKSDQGLLINIYIPIK